MFWAQTLTTTPNVDPSAGRVNEVPISLKVSKLWKKKRKFLFVMQKQKKTQIHLLPFFSMFTKPLIEQLKVIFTPGRSKHVRQFALLFPASHPCKFSLEKVPIIHHQSQTYWLSLSLPIFITVQSKQEHGLVPLRLSLHRRVFHCQFEEEENPEHLCLGIQDYTSMKKEIPSSLSHQRSKLGHDVVHYLKSSIPNMMLAIVLSQRPARMHTSSIQTTEAMTEFLIQPLFCGL